MVVAGESGEDIQTTWHDFSENKKEAMIKLPLSHVDGIVITQDCDTNRCDEICFACINDLTQINEDFSEKENPKNTLAILKKELTKARAHSKWFYLPPDSSMSFSKRMAADFRNLFVLPRTDLQKLHGHRIGRLNFEAIKHFRITLANYFTRYAYNDSYPFSKDECDILNLPLEDRFDYQKA